MKKTFLLVFAFLSLTTFGQAKVDLTANLNSETAKPKLVVGIVVDQMRYDYLTRFYNRFGEGGFKRLMNEGFNCQNNHFNYIPTYTAPGHASIFTGTTPSMHGIIGNNWYDKDSNEDVYCVSDKDYQSVGATDNSGRMSPHRLKVNTITDQLRLHTQFRSKTIGIAIKDRGAILPAGHTAKAAFWFDGDDEGKWISSTYYLDKLPDWVNKFNQSGKAEAYMKPWNTLYDVKTYTESGSDDNTYEGLFKGETKPVFPHDLPKLRKENKNFEMIKSTAFGNSITTDFAIAAIKGEQLGKGSETDFLTLSFSSTDYVGHMFGVNSVEVEDTYLRLDQDLERFLLLLDTEVGKGNYTVFLTADHGAVDVPAYLRDHKIPAGYFDSSSFKKYLKEFSIRKFEGNQLIKDISNKQVFLDEKLISEKDYDLDDVEEAFAQAILGFPKIAETYTATAMRNTDFSKGVANLLQNGYNQKRSGNVLYTLKSGVIDYTKTGSTHGSGYDYDTHVPLLFYGWGIRQGKTVQKTNITDIAPTIAALLGIEMPDGTTGIPLEFVID
ncbi:MAG: alkaline phosphatase [Bacteroidetes bacterium HGW-Bacteroidetes-13]|nr:MAG: alkaline phosphatase [Bacteroidetes bacterium HGW-Bacteroidetes-13]